MTCFLNFDYCHFKAKKEKKKKRNHNSPKRLKFSSNQQFWIAGLWPKWWAIMNPKDISMEKEDRRMILLKSLRNRIGTWYILWWNNENVHIIIKHCAEPIMASIETSLVSMTKYPWQMVAIWRVYLGSDYKRHQNRWRNYMRNSSLSESKEWRRWRQCGLWHLVFSRNEVNYLPFESLTQLVLSLHTCDCSSEWLPWILVKGKWNPNLNWIKKNWKLHYINSIGKFILLSQEQHQGPSV